MPVTYAINLDDLGADKVHEYVGKEPSGRSAGEIVLKDVEEKDRAVPERTAVPHNPLINAGALVCTSLLKPEEALASRLKHYIGVWSDLCGKSVSFDPVVMMAERTHADRNYALAYMMAETHAFEEDVDLDETLELYFSTCAVSATADMVSTAAACLANGGVSPLTNKRVFKESTARMVMSLMLSCGMYDFSGEWAFSVGLPAKSTIAGVVQLIVPNVCGICIWSPPLSSATGNSLKGVQFAKELVNKFSFHHLDHKSKTCKANPTARQSVVFEMMTAAASGDVRTMQLLTDRGHAVTCHDYDQRTPLHLAAAESRADMVDLLLMKGANPAANDRWNHSPLDDAIEAGNEGIIKAIRAAVEDASMLHE